MPISTSAMIACFIKMGTDPIYFLEAWRPRLRDIPGDIAAADFGVRDDVRLPAGIVDAHADAVRGERHHHPAHPVAAADPDLHLAAYLPAFLRHRGARFLLELRACLHHRRGRAGGDVALPGTRVHVAGGIAVDAEAVAPVVEERALVALALPGPPSPRISADAFLAVLDELALVAIAARPGLGAFAVLAPGLEPAFVLRRPARAAAALRQPVDARPGVAPAQLGIDHAALLTLRARNEQQKNRDRPRFSHGSSHASPTVPGPTASAGPFLPRRDSRRASHARLPSA